MNKTMETVTKAAVVAGLFTGAVSCSVDVVTCPGEVETGNSDMPKMVCDENPESDNLINNPGTTEQKIMFGGFAVAVAGGALLAATKWREDSSQVFRFESQQ